MDFLKKFFAVSYLVLTFFAVSPFAFAAESEITGAPSDQAGDTGGTILPQTRFDEINDCERIMFYANFEFDKVKKVVITREAVLFEGLQFSDGSNALVTANDILGCAIKTGDIKLWMIPFYIRYILEFIIGVAGLLVVGGIIYGGYLYLFGALTEQKEQGKKAIINSIIGLVLSLSAWAIVSIVIQFVSR